MKMNEIENIDPKIIEKLKKIYNLAENAKKINSLGEANAALLMFRKIIAKNKLNIDENYFKENCDNDSKDKDINTKILMKIKKRRVFWKQNLCSIISGKFRCKIFIQINNNPSLEYSMYIMIVGHDEDIEIVKYLVQSFITIIENCTNKYIKDIKNKSSYNINTLERAKIKNDYISGFLEGMNTALNEQDNDNQEYALVLSIPKEVEDKYNMILHRNYSKPSSNNLSKQSISSRSYDKKTFMEGYANGYDMMKNKDRRLN